MYDYIRGTLVKKRPNTVVIDVQGVGYQLEVPLSTYEQLNGVDEMQRLWTYLYVRDDAQRLYGFFSETERQLFLELIGVSGIGPKVALGILSGGTVTQVKEQIMQEDVSALKRLPGIGPKTAKRIILELRESLAETMDEREQSDTSPESSLQREGVLALESLGYSRGQAEKAVKAAMKNQESVESIEQLIKSALGTL